MVLHLQWATQYFCCVYLLNQIPVELKGQSIPKTTKSKISAALQITVGEKLQRHTSHLDKRIEVLCIVFSFEYPHLGRKSKSYFKTDWYKDVNTVKTSAN